MATKQKAKAPKSGKPAEKAAPQKKVKKRQQVLKGKHGGMVLVLLEDVPHLGRQGEVVEVKPGYGRNYGELRQRISAVPYRGRRVRLRASIFVLAGDGGRAHLWMRSGAGYDVMHDRPIVTPGWQTHDLELNISATATRIDFGLVLVGDGVVAIDGISLAPV